jgi:hypothetical protein
MNGGKVFDNININAGGGVNIMNNGTFTMNGGEVSGNTANNGGGIRVNGAIFTMTGGKVSGNTASSSGSGGGVHLFSSGKFTMIGGEVLGNTANSGGGVYVVTGTTFRIVTGTIYGSSESTTLQNTAGSGAALFRSGTAERGTFSIPGDVNSTWNNTGYLAVTDDTIRVLNGELQ